VRSLLSFPNPVNEKAARTVAAGVAGLAALTILLSVVGGSGWLWLSAVLAYGFLARVLTGPRLSPLGQVATRIVAPRLGPARLVPGPPKRFAQGMGAVITTSAFLCFVAGADAWVVQTLLGLVVIAAVLESGFAYCIGCRVFAALMAVGVIPAEVCLACADIRLRADVA
jgi:hypothetical protein